MDKGPGPMVCNSCSKWKGVLDGRIEGSLVNIIEARLAESQPSGWSYRLSPHLELRARGPDRVEPALQVLLVQSGRAFGPGHPTTRLCLDLLRETLAPGPVPRLADVGCGAGVLTLAAAALGVPRVVGVDLAWEAARVTRKNARENGLAGAISAVQGFHRMSSGALRPGGGQPALGSAAGKGAGAGPPGGGSRPSDSLGIP